VGDAIIVSTQARRSEAAGGEARGQGLQRRSLGKSCRRSPRKLHRLRTAKPASDRAEIDTMIAPRAPALLQAFPM
jgi:hypothetical protein